MGDVSCRFAGWERNALCPVLRECFLQVFREHSSVAEMLRRHTEPISLSDCLDAFCSEETLEYSCDKCRKMQQASKKLQIWRLPPVLVSSLAKWSFP